MTEDNENPYAARRRAKLNEQYIDDGDVITYEDHPLFQPVSEETKQRRKRIAALVFGVLGLAAVSGLGVMYQQMEQKDKQHSVMRNPEAEKVNRVKELFNYMDEASYNIGDLERNLLLSQKGGPIVVPGEVVQRLQAVHYEILASVEILKQIKTAGFKVNSAVSYRQIRNFDENLARLEANSVFRNLTATSGNGVSAECSGLKKDLVGLRNLLGDIADANLSTYSNLGGLNKEKESPRERFRFMHGPILVLLKNDLARREGRDSDVRTIGCDGADAYRAFLVQYGLVDGYPEDGFMGDSKYDEAVHKISEKGKSNYKAAMKAGLYGHRDFLGNGRKTISPQVKQLQELLARAGYLDYRKIDSQYGETTDKAFQLFFKEDTIDDFAALVEADGSKL